MGDKKKGTVKWFNKEKGFGFVKDEEGKELFVHHSSVKEGHHLKENDPVTFEEAETERGKQAKNVEKDE
jgi:CspA family cold shock protein